MPLWTTPVTAAVWSQLQLTECALSLRFSEMASLISGQPPSSTPAALLSDAARWRSGSPMESTVVVFLPCPLPQPRLMARRSMAGRCRRP